MAKTKLSVEERRRRRAAARAQHNQQQQQPLQNESNTTDSISSNPSSSRLPIVLALPAQATFRVGDILIHYVSSDDEAEGEVIQNEVNVTLSEDNTVQTDIKVNVGEENEVQADVKVAVSEEQVDASEELERNQVIEPFTGEDLQFVIDWNEATPGDLERIWSDLDSVEKQNSNGKAPGDSA